MESDIESWIMDRLSISLPEFNDLPPCPFAKQAWLDGKVSTHHLKAGKFNLSMSDYFRAELENFSYHWPKGREVIVLGTDPKNISAYELSKTTELANTDFLQQRGYLALEDHPAEKETVANYVVNQGDWALILLQPRQKITDARRILQHKNYYKNWDTDYYHSVVVERS